MLSPRRSERKRKEWTVGKLVDASYEIYRTNRSRENVHGRKIIPVYRYRASVILFFSRPVVFFASVELKPPTSFSSRRHGIPAYPDKFHSWTG